MRWQLKHWACAIVFDGRARGVVSMDYGRGAAKARDDRGGEATRVVVEGEIGLFVGGRVDGENGNGTAVYMIDRAV